ncbi:DUF7528 family protein [Halococcus hamelinensis]|uniref:DUF7528 family protein n=1 Tax=Halococcus hamelinensis TaxID=332168 RepID=UPI0009A1890C|nr:hypothetical protein [Halococcus hamelinensis]
MTVSVAGRTHELTRAEAVSLREALDDSLARHREFVRTTGTHRPDGSYVVARRGVESAGHRKVFDSFEALRDLFGSLPASFTADDVDTPAVSGRRRHLVVRHLAEHPDFPCELVARQPLTAEKRTSPEVATEEL